MLAESLANSCVYKVDSRSGGEATHAKMQNTKSKMPISLIGGISSVCHWVRNLKVSVDTGRSEMRVFELFRLSP